MQVKAQSKNVKISPRKARRVISLIRGKMVDRAMGILKVLPHKGARLIEKVVKSAAANAKNNYKANAEKLIISKAYVDEASSFRRFKARSRGRVSPIKKRNSHITVWVQEKSEKGE
jgi:large subunit ribosomal protein L22